MEIAWEAMADEYWCSSGEDESKEGYGILCRSFQQRSFGCAAARVQYPSPILLY